MLKPILAEPQPSLQDDPRPGFAILAPELTPYRIHFHRRIVQEIPELRLWSLVVKDSQRSFWKYRDGADIGTVRFAEGEIALKQGRLSALKVELQKARLVTRWLAERRPKAILSAGYMDLPNLAALRWGRRNRVATLMWSDSNIHGDTATGAKRLAKNAIVPWVLRQTDAVLVCGRLGREYFLRYRADPKRIFYSPYEPDYEQIANLPREVIERVAQRYSLRPDRKRLLFCGRLVLAKRPDLAIDAFAAVSARRPEWDLVLAGEGPMRESLQARVPAHLRERVVFTGFIGDQQEVTALNHLSEVLLHPAQAEPWGLVINEAVAAGLAFVTTTVVGAAAELVRDGVNGRVCPPNNLPCLVQALEEVTSAGRLEAMKAASLRVLGEWRAEADPVRGLRTALQATGAIG